MIDDTCWSHRRIQLRESGWVIGVSLIGHTFDWCRGKEVYLVHTGWVSDLSWVCEGSGGVWFIDSRSVEWGMCGERGRWVKEVILKVLKDYRSYTAGSKYLNDGPRSRALVHSHPLSVTVVDCYQTTLQPIQYNNLQLPCLWRLPVHCRVHGQDLLRLKGLVTINREWSSIRDIRIRIFDIFFMLRYMKLEIIFVNQFLVV